MSGTNQEHRVFKGVSLAPGYGEGRAFVYTRNGVRQPPQYKIHEAQVEAEVYRFDQALEKSAQELDALRDRVREEIGGKESEIFHAHMALLKDPDFVENCKARISRDLVNVEHAVEMGIRDLEQVLLDLETEYLRERARDVRDIGQRVLRHLILQRGHQLPALSSLPERSVIVARELMSSDTIEMDREHVAGIVTELGGPSSHSAILARSLGVPSVTNVRGFLKAVNVDDWVLVDGEKGTAAIVAPKGDAKQFEVSKRDYDAISTKATEEESGPCATKDGVEIQLQGNIGRVQDARDIRTHNLAGAGLVRTEFLFLNTGSRPDVHKHTSAYQSIAEQVGNGPVVIRTLDLGGDKRPAFLSPEVETNPAMGLRGLRFSLAEQRLLRTQLRGILRTDTTADVRVLFPMVLGAGDLREALALLHAVAEEEGKPVPSVGAMIETPAAVFELDEILKLVDFVSIGTNDLTQFTLAADRESTGMLGHFSILHPAVLKAVRQVLATARDSGKQASICGEAAGDPATASLFVGMGSRQLSMSPVRAARVRRLLMNCRCSELESAAEAALSASTPTEVERKLTDATAPWVEGVGLPKTAYEFGRQQQVPEEVTRNGSDVERREQHG